MLKLAEDRLGVLHHLGENGAPAHWTADVSHEATP
jgi:hypothetical protein